jgi:hypothetical protein
MRKDGTIIQYFVLRNMFSTRKQSAGKQVHVVIQAYYTLLWQTVSFAVKG